MIDLFSLYFMNFLKFCHRHILIYSLPTNPVTGIIYIRIAYYGYTKLKTRVDLDLKRFSNRLLVFVYSVCLLGFINFMLENVWLTAFYLKYTFFNEGWLTQIYFEEPNGWIINFLRNFVYLLVLHYLSYPIWKHTNFNKKTLVGFLSISIYIFLFFFLSPHYAFIDWTYGLKYDFPVQTVFGAFIIAFAGKPLLFYTFYTVWSQKKVNSHITHKYTLDVGCGAKPLGTINVDRLIPDDDWTVYDKHDIPNLFVADASYLPFRTGIFSKTYCIHIMEHITEDLKVYNEINRVSKDEIEIRVPLGIFEFFFNNILFWRRYKNWRVKHHVRSYSKKSFKQTLTTVFPDKEIKISYGYPGLLKGIKLEVDRSSKLVFPFPFELVAVIT